MCVRMSRSGTIHGGSQGHGGGGDVSVTCHDSTALGAPASDAPTVGGDPSPPCSTALPMLILASLGSSFVVVVTADPASGARATESVTEALT